MNKINKTIKFGRSLIGMPYTQNMYKKWEANNTPPYYAVTPKTSKDQL